MKSNLNTDSKDSTAHSPQAIASNFIDSMEAINLAFGNIFKYNLFLVFESADRLGTRKMPTMEWLGDIQEKLTQYREDIRRELEKNNQSSINEFNVKSIFECTREIIDKVILPGSKKVRCFKFNNEVKVYPFHKNSLLKFLEIFSDDKFDL